VGSAAQGPFGRRTRFLIYGSDACILLSGIGFAAVVGKHWDWSPFLASVAAAAAGFGAMMLFLHVVGTKMTMSDDELRTARQRLRVRNRINIPNYAAIGLACGTVAGSIPSYWPAVLLAAANLITGVGLPLALLPMVKRKADARRATGGSG
jgi:hypothetical protein